MKTEDLIHALAQDHAGGSGSIGARLLRALPPALALSGVLFFATMGLRPQLFSAGVAPAVLVKLGVTLTLAFAGWVCARRALAPGRGAGATRLLFALPLGVLFSALALEMNRRGFEAFSQRLFGANYWRCMLAIPMLSLAPLGALLFAARQGAPEEPARAGVLAGLAAAGLGASLYALHCPDDSPLFILAWYSLASLVMALVGRVAGARLLRW